MTTTLVLMSLIEENWSLYYTANTKG